MKHNIVRKIELNDEEIKCAILHWLKNVHDKPTPKHTDSVCLVKEEDGPQVTAYLSWEEDIPEPPQ